MSLSDFPEVLDVFTPMVDGYHPVDAEDFNQLIDAINNILDSLGWGANSDNTAYGPKGANTSVASRLDAFLDSNGNLKQVCLVSGASPISDFAIDKNPPGKYIPFPTPIYPATTPGYFVFFQAIGDPETTQYSSVPEWNYSYLSSISYTVITKHSNGCRITFLPQYAPNGYITSSMNGTVRWYLLVIGGEAII